MSQVPIRGDTNSSSSRNIISSGNSELDQILGGGIPRSSLIMLVGAPGTGKTTLALQMCFQWPHLATPPSAARTPKTESTALPDDRQLPPKAGNSETPGLQTSRARVQGAERSIYFSLLSESHDKLISHASQFSFFKPEQLNDTVKFFSLSSQLEKSHREVLDFIVKTVRQEKAGLVVIDGFTALAEMFNSKPFTRQFLFTLSSQLTILGATVLISVERSSDASALLSADLTVADGVVSFTSRLEGAGEYFAMQVVKLRGMKRLLGLHSYAITDNGVEFYPRLEALVKTGVMANRRSPNVPGPVFDGPQENRVQTPVVSSGETLPQVGTGVRNTFGLPELEKMLGGGLPVYSSTLIAGSVGVGKTLLGIHFLVEGVRIGERGLFLGFYEDHKALYRKARDFNMDLEKAHKTGMVELLTIPPFELEPDRLMQQVRQVIEGKGISRLVVDGFSELELACRSTNRGNNFAAAFELYLKQRNVTVIYTHPIPGSIPSELDLSDTPFARMAENLLLMRQGEYNNLLYRIISVRKMRDSDFDRTIREFTISDSNGIEVLKTVQSAPGLLSGLAQKLDNGSNNTFPPDDTSQVNSL